MHAVKRQRKVARLPKVESNSIHSDKDRKRAICSIDPNRACDGPVNHERLPCGYLDLPEIDSVFVKPFGPTMTSSGKANGRDA